MFRYYSILIRSFPVHLLKIQLRSNLLLTSLWALVFLFVSGWVGKSYGIQYLFLDPEYHGQVDFWSFFITGLGFSSFLIAWDTSIYIINSYNYPFLASLSRPFTKFVLNNGLLPLIFYLYYVVKICSFQYYNEYAAQNSIFMYILGLFLGTVVGVLIASGYFFTTNKDIFTFLKNKDNWNKMLVNQSLSVPMLPRDSKLSYYLSEDFHIRIIRDVSHYDRELLDKVFRQNHFNALIIQFISIGFLFLSAIFMDEPLLRIPAAASVFILLAVLVSILGAITYWLGQWRGAFLMLFVISLNFFYSMGWHGHENRIYGLNYDQPLKNYNNSVIDSLAKREYRNQDYLNTLDILERWKLKNTAELGWKKPKMLIICSSGGGLRATAWAFSVLQEADSMTQGQLMKQCALITGASGGQIGAAYYRDLFIEKQNKNKNITNLHQNQWYENITRDLLNPIIFTAVINDVFRPWTIFEYNEHLYYKDRGYAFEKQLIENTDSLLAKPLKAYYSLERQGKIPLLISSPTIIDDGRKLIVGSQKLAYMMMPANINNNEIAVIPDAIDFQRYFEKKGAKEVKMATILRLSATYPFILPNVNMPTLPNTEAMDAGFRDNYGTSLAVRFVKIFSKWIEANTSGVVILQIQGCLSSNDLEKTRSKSKDVIEHTKSYFDKLLNPMGTISKFTELQIYDQNDLLAHLSEILGKDKLDIIKLQYLPNNPNELASISFHLTKRERMEIRQSVYHTENQKALRKLAKLLKL